MKELQTGINLDRVKILLQKVYGQCEVDDFNAIFYAVCFKIMDTARATARSGD